MFAVYEIIIQGFIKKSVGILNFERRNFIIMYFHINYVLNKSLPVRPFFNKQERDYIIYCNINIHI